MSLHDAAQPECARPMPPPVWRRTFVWLGRTMGGLTLILIVGSLGVLATVNAMNRSAADFAGDAVAAISDPWNAQAFIAKADPGALPENARKTVVKTFHHFSVLGNLQWVGAPAGRIGLGAYPGTAVRGLWAEYRVNAQYARGPAQYFLLVAHTQSGWRIAALEISSPLFARQEP